MSQPKVLHALLLFLFVTVVTVGIFFLLSMQLNPLFDEIGGSISTTSSIMAEASLARPTPTATMPALTLDMVATVPATTAPTTAPTTVPVAPTPRAPAVLASTDLPVRTGTVNSDFVNLRSYPSLAGEVVGQAKQGERFEIAERSQDGQWVRVCCPLGNSEGTRQSWVATEFMLLEPPVLPAQHTEPATTIVADPVGSEALVTAANQSRPGASSITGTVNSTLVNLRSGPDTTYATVGQVGEQTAVKITGRNAAGTWWRICCPPGAPQESWVSAEFINLAVSKEAAMGELSVTGTE